MKKHNKKQRKISVNNRDLPTPVIFRKFKIDGSIIALFPNEQFDLKGRFMLSYMRIGQHGGADYNGLLDITVLATPSEYKDLLEELVSIGYDNLIVMQKRMR